VQAARARDERVRTAMTRIARDETRHAPLSWDVARWIEPRLGPAARHRVKTARARAVDALAQAASLAASAHDVDRGLPDAGQTASLVSELRATLWSEPS
jgi:rubrerythrin